MMNDGVTRFKLIVGLPCSGKSFFCAKAPKSTIIIDDPKDFATDIVAKVKPGHCHWIADCHLCNPQTREIAVQRLLEAFPSAPVGFWFFENNPEKCLKNYRIRRESGDTRVVKSMIQDMSLIYEIDKGAKIQPIWQADTKKVHQHFPGHPHYKEGKS